MKQKHSILDLLMMNLSTILFIAGLIIINISIYQIYDTEIGLLATGITVVAVGLIMNHEQTNST